MGVCGRVGQDCPCRALTRKLMANYKEQLLRAWEQFEAETGADAINPDDFVTWAMENEKWRPRPQDVRKILKKEMTTALRQVMRENENGVTYRAKQCVKVLEDGEQIPLWFDVDFGGTERLRRRAARQRRDAIAADVFRARSDVDHMNFKFPSEKPIQFHLDFTEDYEERRAIEKMKWQERKRKRG